VNWLDWLLAVIISASLLAGLARGFARTVVGFVAVLVGIVLGSWCYGVAGGWLREYVSHRAIANFIGFAIVFIAVVGAGTLAGFLLAKLFKWVGLGWLDRLMGAALGLVRGALFATVLVMVLCAFTRTPPPSSVAASRLAPYLIDAGGVLVAIAPRELKDGFDESQRRVKKMWEQIWKKAQRLPVREL
jgi:membrane protein required for colicin V production